jgi:hypothetical protein
MLRLLNTLGKSTPDNHWIGAYVRHRDGWGIVEGGALSLLGFEPQTVQPIA